jgi:ferredoxin
MLELVPDERQPNEAVIDFCTICKKCAENCPSKSISFDKREEIDGALRWRINPDTCFSYWNVIGTDCGICMTVCPFSHPDTAPHNILRWGIARSGLYAEGRCGWMTCFMGKILPAGSLQSGLEFLNERLSHPNRISLAQPILKQIIIII